MKNSDLPQVSLTRLERMSWSERLDLAQRLVAALTCAMPDESTRNVIHRLARDAKGEIRQQIAYALVHLPADVFAPLALALGNDSNDCVRRAAQRAIHRRQAAEQTSHRTSQSANHVEDQLNRMNEQFGPRVGAQVRRVCQRYGELLAGTIVHDLRSVLTHLKCNCLALADEAAGAGVASRNINRVRRDVEFLESVVSDMTTFIQPAPGVRTRERLAKIVQVALAIARDNLAKLGFDPEAVAISLDVAETLTTDVAGHLMVMALANIIKNAYEAYATGNNQLRQGRILIAGRLVGKNVVVTIVDNGMGIIAGEVVGQALFIPGRRNKSKAQSTGYGLPIAQRNITAHGGTLEIRGEENQGTTVTLTWPRFVEGATINEDASTHRRGRSAGHRRDRGRPVLHRARA